MAELMDIIELEIKSSLEEIPGRAQSEQWIGETPWTKAVKQAIVNVGKKFDYLTAASGCDSDDGQEWVYDIVWYQLDNAMHMTDVTLVAECEWGGDRIPEEDDPGVPKIRCEERQRRFGGPEMTWASRRPKSINDRGLRTSHLSGKIDGRSMIAFPEYRTRPFSEEIRR